MSKYLIDPDRPPAHHECLRAVIDFICDGGSHDLERHPGDYVTWSNRERAQGRARPDAKQIREVIGGAQDVGDAVAALLASIGKSGTRVALNEYRALTRLFASEGAARDTSPRTHASDPTSGQAPGPGRSALALVRTPAAAADPRTPDGFYEHIVDIAQALELRREDVIGVRENLELALRPIFDDATSEDSENRAARLATALSEGLGELGSVIDGLELSIRDLADATEWLGGDLLEDIGGIMWH